MKYSNQNDDLMLIDPQLNRIGGSGKSSRAYLSDSAPHAPG